MDHIKADKRFSHISRDPRFRRLHRKERKVQIDKRFKGMFNDKRFKLKYMVDKRGRPIHSTTNENLRKYYDLSDSDESDGEAGDDEDGQRESTDKKKVQNKEKQQSNKTKQLAKVTEDREDEERNESDDTSSEDDDSSPVNVLDGPDLARGEGDIFSSDDDDDYEPEDSVVEEHPWGEMDADAPEAEDVSRRLGVCNMDWDRIKAEDLMVLFNSFKPTGGIIRSVTIYPSEYGLQRMKEEEIRGPTELVNPDPKNHKDDDDEYHTEQLRKYQLNRLKYYYAVVECDSSHTASKIYDECDGMEYEGSSARLDLRYIPDDMTFTDQEPKSQVSDVPDTNAYKPSRFLTSALQQSKVNLTWDETDRNRVAVTMRKFSKDDLENLDVQDYLASDSDDAANPYGDLIETPDFGQVSSEEDEERQIQKYRQLLQGIQESTDKGSTHKDSTQPDSTQSDNDMDMEISWEPGLKDATSDLVKKNQNKESKSPWEEYLEKRKEKRKKKRKEKKSKQNSTEADQSQEDQNGISDDDLPEGVDLDDPYFKEELQNKPAKGKSEMVERKMKKKKNKQNSDRHSESEGYEEKRRKAELELLLLEEDNKKHFNLKTIMEEEKPLKGKKKRRMRKMKEIMAEKKKQVQDDFQIDIDDSRFKDLYSNPLYNLDPTAPEFKKTKAMETVIQEKIRRRVEKKKVPRAPELDATDGSPSKKVKKDIAGDGDSAKHSKDPSLASLVKSVKAKTKSAQEKKKHKSRGAS